MNPPTNNLGFALQSNNILQQSNISPPILTPKKPPGAKESLLGPSITKLGDANKALLTEAASDSNTSGDINNLFKNPANYINEATTRAICNGTSQLASIICASYITSGYAGTILEFIENGENVAVNTLNKECFETRYGCCFDGVTTKLNVEGSNCGKTLIDLKCAESPYGCCKDSDIIKDNLIGTNCPEGAKPLIGWDEKSTPFEKSQAGVGFKSTMANTPGFIP